MEPDVESTSKSKTLFWVGWVLSILPVLMLVLSGTMKILQPPQAVEGFEKLGWPMNVAIGLAVVEFGSTLLYLIPQTAVLGAILLTGYLGGAIATHVRVGDYSSLTMPILMGIFIWLGLYLRDPRLRALVPLRS
jgi:DoxX-like family